MVKPIILDLCGGTGSWSKYYRESGRYEVFVIDPYADGTDVRFLEFKKEWVGRVQGVLCAPPCTVFANSGARWPRTKQDMLDGLSVMDACLRIVQVYRPKWWALENPAGKMRRYLGDPTLIFDPCDFGDPYTKKTLLWGVFTSPMKNKVNPTQGSKMHLMFGGKSARTKRERSKTPEGFSKAFFEANP